MASVEKKKVALLSEERKRMAEEIRRKMEESLLDQVRKIKAEEAIMKEQRDDFLQSVQHFTKRIQASIKEM